MVLRGIHVVIGPVSLSYGANLLDYERRRFDWVKAGFDWYRLSEAGSERVGGETLIRIWYFDSSIELGAGG